MLVPTNQMIITALKDNEEDKYRELLNNSVKIDFSYIRDMSETSNKIVTCQNKLCEAVLSIRVQCLRLRKRGRCSPSRSTAKTQTSSERKSPSLKANSKPPRLIP